MVKILFVCLGNICRSPAAEGIMQRLLKDAGLTDQVLCDSAGTSGSHAGEKADARMRQHSAKRGYNLLSRSRRFSSPSDFENFDYILAMDNDNLSVLHAYDEKRIYRPKIFKMTDFCINRKDQFVPDPYFGGDAGFENVIDILEDACSGLLEHIKSANKL